MMRRLLLPLLFALFLSPLQAQEQGATVLLDSLLRAEPYIDAEVIGKLKARAQVTVVERSGGWYQVRDSRNRSGWLRMSAIRLGDGSSSAGGDSGIGQTLRFLSTGRSGASGVTVATGIRGLDAADVANATPDHEAVSKLDRHRTSAAEAQRFARSAGLRSHQIDYLKEPQ
ncbi:MAG: SH3 domain-containing protein [Gammaproteobacteria bacterium]|nr:SH3 domain-containing protein [Gammaproteobacteria bacterium]